MPLTAVVASPADAPRTNSNGPVGACVRCRRIKTKCLTQDGQSKCRACSRGGYDCIFVSRAEREAEKRRKRETEHQQSVARIRRSPVADTRTDVSQDSRSGGMPAAMPASSVSLSSPPSAATTDATNPASPGLEWDGGAEDDDDTDLTAEMVSQCQQLLQTFIWPFSPFHWPTFKKRMAERQVERSLYYAMLASTSRASRQITARFNNSPMAASDFFAAKARRCVMASLDRPSLDDVQAMLLVVLLDWGARRGTRAFIFLGLTARMALTFLPDATMDQKRTASEPPVTSAEFVAAETARRTIWMVFMLEQYLSSGRGRVPAIHVCDLPISLPCSEMDFLFGTPSVVPMLDGNMPPHHLLASTAFSSSCSASSPLPSKPLPLGVVGEYGSMIQVSRLWNLVATAKFQSPHIGDDAAGWNLEQALAEWKVSLTARYQDEPGHLDLHVSLGTGVAFGFCHCVYHGALIFLSRETLHEHGLGAERSPPGDDEMDSESQECREAVETIFRSAERIIDIMNGLEVVDTPANMIIFPLFMLYTCYIAASAIGYVSIQNWTASRHVSFKVVRESLRILRDMRQTWPLVEEWYAQLASMVKTLQDRAVGINNEAIDPGQGSSLAGLEYGQVGSELAVGSGSALSTTAGVDGGGILGSCWHELNLGPQSTYDDLSDDLEDMNMFLVL